MSKLLVGGITVTALHNHLLRNQPFTMYMHVHGMGDPVKLAGALHAALAESKTPFPAADAGNRAAPPALDLDTAALDQALGAKGTTMAASTSSASREPIRSGDGMAVPAAMGSAIAINFQPTGGGKAAITGDFVLTAKEVNPVCGRCGKTGSRSPRCTTTCWTSSRGCSSCISGPTTTRGSSRRG